MRDELVVPMDFPFSRGTAAVLAATLVALVTSVAVTGGLALPAPGALEAMDDPAVEGETSFNHHPPILIRGDEGATGFILGHDPLTGEAIHRSGSGVMDGTGTQDDPYVISGWRTPSIHMNDTSAHVVVENNAVGLVDQGSADSDGILLEETQNVQVKSNTVHEARSCIVVHRSRDVAIGKNEVTECGEQGILVRESHRATLEQNRVDGATKAIELSKSKDVEVRANILGRSHTAVYGLQAEDVLVEGNEIASLQRGIHFVSSQNVTIRSHVIESMEVAGIILWYTEAATTKDNVLRDLPAGLNVVAGGHHVHQGNLIESSQQGIVITNDYSVLESVPLTLDDPHAWILQLLQGQSWEERSGAGGHAFLGNEIRRNAETGAILMTDAPNVTFSGNNIHENGVGLDNSGNTDEIDARGNWWGCSGGPGAPGCDLVAGPVHTDPRLTQENPQAGA